MSRWKGPVTRAPTVSTNDGTSIDMREVEAILRTKILPRMEAA